MGTVDNYDKLIREATGKRFTRSEARAFQRHLDTMPTGKDHSWRDMTTGALIAFTT